ncbi:hypothetical protein FGG08_005771 [Glutinoglossum americanum]|uniref:Uncharacterized protein n=1 Tax=Glutinoglossum americanum TaxID=1670608 RepID=A0A9P8I2Y2_9PEZI|nr:hypothetical protein FGG08_005771 [Glutinoglossum americanum]
MYSTHRRPLLAEHLPSKAWSSWIAYDQVAQSLDARNGPNHKITHVVCVTIIHAAYVPPADRIRAKAGFSTTADVYSLGRVAKVVGGDMSDEEDFLDDEYWEYEDCPNDGVAAWADDLAEHTIHSPVWADIDPNFEMEEFWSDWENYSDDYYDGDTRKSTKVEGNGIRSSPKPGEKRKRAISDSVRRKRRKREERTPSLSLGDSLDASAVQVGLVAPIVIWRAKGSPERPLLHDSEEAEEVSVLKDWRERLQSASHTNHRSEESKTTAKPAGGEVRNAVKVTSNIALGSTQTPARKSARLRSHLPIEEINARAIAGGEENGVPHSALSVIPLPEGPSDKGIMKKSNSKVMGPPENVPKVARATTRSARNAGGAGQKRKAPEPKENDRTSKKKGSSNGRNIEAE